MTPFDGVVIVLLVMLTRAGFVTIDRLLRFRAARSQSRTFVQQSASAFRQHNLGEVMAVAGQNHKSHIAKITASGLASGTGAPLRVRHEEAIEAAKRGMKRASATIHAEMKRGLGSLATIASTAPFIGLFGTVLGILGAFRPMVGSRMTMMVRTTEQLSEALMATAMGLLAALPAIWCYNYLSSRIECFEIEMENASSELVSYLTNRRGWHTQLQPCSGVNAEASFLNFSANPKRKQAWEASYDRHTLVLLTLWFFWLFFVFKLAP